jgi:hypothetical protein
MSIYSGKIIKENDKYGVAQTQPKQKVSKPNESSKSSPYIPNTKQKPHVITLPNEIADNKKSERNSKRAETFKIKNENHMKKFIENYEKSTFFMDHHDNEGNENENLPHPIENDIYDKDMIRDSDIVFEFINKQRTLDENDKLKDTGSPK